jgi:large subunit ribosomal protein L5
MTRYQTFLKQVISYDLITRFQYRNSFQLPILKKISINVGSMNADKNKLLAFFIILELLSGQQSKLTFSKKNKIQFKIKKGMVVGCRITLNSKKSYEFLETLNTFVFPTLKIFSGLPSHSQHSSFSFSLSQIFAFPELANEYKLLSNSLPIHITINLCSATNRERNLFLTSLNFPISRK